MYDSESVLDDLDRAILAFIVAHQSFYRRRRGTKAVDIAGEVDAKKGTIRYRLDKLSRLKLLYVTEEATLSYRLTPEGERVGAIAVR